MDAPASRPSKRLFTFASGGWVIALALVIALLIVAFWVVPIVRHPHPRAIGDGKNPATYGFALQPALVPVAELVASGMPKDGLPALVDPDAMPGREVDAYNAEQKKAHRAKYLVPSDPVAGVVLNGEARAYPIRLLVWHEVVNDTVGGVPVAVSYSALGGTLVAFDRRVGGETLTFAVPGLLYQSNSLVYDRRAGGRGESLWCPLQFRAVTGPAAAAARALTPVPVQLVPWSVWSAKYPDTRVLRPDPQYYGRYKEEPYSSYYGSDALRFPVHPLPPDDGVPLKTPAVVLESDGVRQAIVLGTASAGMPAAAPRTLRTTVGARAVRVEVAGAPPWAWIEAEDGGAPPIRAHAFRFSWYALGDRP